MQSLCKCISFRSSWDSSIKNLYSSYFNTTNFLFHVIFYYILNKSDFSLTFLRVYKAHCGYGKFDKQMKNCSVCANDRQTTVLGLIRDMRFCLNCMKQSLLVRPFDIHSRLTCELSDHFLLLQKKFRKKYITYSRARGRCYYMSLAFKGRS